jgi:predicted nucleotidyltransferase
MVPMGQRLRITIDQQRLGDLCRRHGVARLSLFGSVMRDDFGPRSDVDVLVEFAPSPQIGLLDVARFQLELSELLGREVQVSTPGSLSRYFRQSVVDSAVPVYVAA